MKSEEIARLAGVSRSTVSRVINHYPNVPEETRERVMKVIREYHYEPNNSARVLAGKGTNTLGLFLFTVHDTKRTNRIYGNSYFAPFVDAVVDAGNYSGYYVLVHTIYNPSDCCRIKQTFQQKRIDGGIIVGTEKNREIQDIIRELSYPLAIVDYDPDEIKGIMRNDGSISVINSNDEKGINACVDYLVSLGHTEIGLIEGRASTYSGLMRSKYFKARMAHHGLSVDSNFILKGDFIGSSTGKAVSKLVKSGRLPSAIVSASDDMALAAIDTFKVHHIRVPEDISIIGYDDAPVSAMVKPALTTVQVPFFDMAQQAVKSLSGFIESNQQGLQVYNMDVKLITRESCNQRK